MADLTGTAMAAIVLVHGGFVDGSGWEDVYRILKKDGYQVSIVQNPTVVARRRRGGHEARRRRAEGAGDPRRPLLRRRGDHRGRQRSEGRGARLHRGVRAGQGRVGGLADQGPAARRAGAADPAAAGRLPLARQGEVRRLVRRPTWPRTRPRSWPTRRCRGASTRSTGAVSTPAWKSKPSWYLVATDDRMIPPAAQRFMSKRAGATTVESAGQPRGLRVAAAGGGRHHQAGGAGRRPIVQALAGVLALACLFAPAAAGEVTARGLRRGGAPAPRELPEQPVGRRGARRQLPLAARHAFGGAATRAEPAPLRRADRRLGRGHGPEESPVDETGVEVLQGYAQLRFDQRLLVAGRPPAAGVRLRAPHRPALGT